MHNNKEKLIKDLINCKGQGINGILIIAYEILENPILMNDITYKLLAYTENTVTDDFLWNEIIELGTFSHKTVNFFSTANFIDDVANTDVISILKSKKIKYDRANAKIFDKDDIHIANICVIACYRPFKKEDFENIELICEVLSEEIQKSEYYQNLEGIFAETSITKLIEGNTQKEEIIENKMVELYDNLKTNIYVGIVDITKYDESLIHLVYFRDLLKSINKNIKYFIYLNNIVMLISTDDFLLDKNKELKDIISFCEENNIYIGISSSFQNLFELNKYYKQALTTLNYGLNTGPFNNAHIFEYDNFRLNCFLNSIQNNTNIRDLCHPVIFLIEEYDKKNKTTFYNQLYTYLIVGRNYKKAAKTLKISLRKFQENINKATDIFGIDWNNGDMLANIYISFNLANNFFR